MNEEQNLERFVANDTDYNISFNGKKGVDAIAELDRKKKEEEAMAYEKYIPLGSVVSLEDSQKLMVIGYNGSDGTTNYDYIGCEFPYGIDMNHQASLFNHDMISKFFNIGYINAQGNYYRSQVLKEDHSDTVQKS